jgi:serine/threonine protein phosphatase PrpC
MQSESRPAEADPIVTYQAIHPLGAGGTDIGQREHNEDHVLLRPDLGLFLLADGAGGHNAGNVASALATTTVANVFETSAAALAGRPDVDQFGLWTLARRLATAIQRANAEVIDIAKKAQKYKGMGTTIVAAAFSPDGDLVHIAHLGDSRCYRQRDGVLEALTTDHSLLVDVLETHPDVEDQLLARMPQHVVTRAMGMEENVRVPVRSLRVVPGDLYLLCSDGMTDVLDDDQLEEMLLEVRTPDQHVRALIEASLAAGAQDNVAAVVIVCEERGAPPPRRRPSARPVPEVAPVAVTTSRGTLNSAPEIVIVGVETHVVPADSASASLMDALGKFARLRAPSMPEISQPKSGACPECGQPLEAGVKACPTCGAKV